MAVAQAAVGQARRAHLQGSEGGRGPLRRARRTRGERGHDGANAFGAALPEYELRPDLDELRLVHEPEPHHGLVARPQNFVGRTLWYAIQQELKL